MWKMHDYEKGLQLATGSLQNARITIKCVFNKSNGNINKTSLMKLLGRKLVLVPTGFAD